MLANANRIRFHLSFVPYGSVLNPEPRMIAVDVGNRLCPGIIDHHQPGEESECAASLVVRYPQFVLEHLKDVAVEDVTLITHIAPDLDAVTSAFLCQLLLTAGKLPPFAAGVAAYVRDVDRGICFRYPGEIVTVSGIFSGICELIRRQSEREGLDNDGEYRLRMEQGFSLWEFVLGKLDETTDLHRSSVFSGSHPFGEAHELILHDHESYAEDLRHAREMEFTLLSKYGAAAAKVDALVALNPRSVLFRSWARGDSVHSPRGRGYTLLLVNYDHKRYVISVDPQSPYTLKGLGDLLEAAETEKRRQLGCERRGEPRPGYLSPDPWYDGRNPLHNYTIVDTPRNGTVLTQEEILALVAEYCAGFERNRAPRKSRIGEG